MSTNSNMSSAPALQDIREAVGAAVRNTFERITGWSVYTISPRGMRLERDIQTYIPRLDVQMIFDVGANVGQSAIHYVEAYPLSTIYSFEPVSNTFAALKANVASSNRVRCFQTAFGAEAGEATMDVSEKSVYNHFVERRNDDEARVLTEIVPVETVDQFCNQHGIERINLLKIDTEGHDLNVLKGATRMLSEKKIDLVETEVGMNPFNTLHVSFESVKEHMQELGYYVFSVYEQVDTSLRGPILQRVNAVFVSKHLVR